MFMVGTTGACHLVAASWHPWLSVVGTVPVVLCSHAPSPRKGCSALLWAN